jgi:hypothetical protein
MKVDIYTVVKDQKKLAKFFLDHYNNAFPECTFHIFDNNSTDGTRDVFSGSNCIVENYPEYDEWKIMAFKNTIWKDSKANWVIVCDIDEILMITPENLSGQDLIQFKGYQMISMNDVYKYNPAALDHGFRDQRYDKIAMFRPSLKEINYGLGAHTAEPVPGGLNKSVLKYKLLHYNEAFVATTTPKPDAPHPVYATFNHANYHKKNVSKAIKVR